MWKHAVKILPYLSMYVPGQYKTDKAFLENGATLKSVPNC